MENVNNRFRIAPSLFRCLWLLIVSITAVLPLTGALAGTPRDVRHEIAFIESNVADYRILAAGVKPGTELHVLNSAKDGLSEMASIMAGRSDINVIHLLSHGTAGALQLGSLNLTSQNLPEYNAELATLRGALQPGGDILLYGCSVAAGKDGAAFVSGFAKATGANVAASQNPTGFSAAGGDWNLEYEQGTISSSAYRINGYRHLLAPTVFTFEAGDGTLVGTDYSTKNGYFQMGGYRLKFASTDENLVDVVWDGRGNPTTGANSIVFGVSNWETLVTGTITATDDSPRIFDLKSIELYNDYSEEQTFIITSDLGGSQSFTVAAYETTGSQAITMPNFNGISWFRITSSTDKDPAAGNQYGLLFVDQVEVDNIQPPGPTVTDANISISGATGAGGAYKIGDVVTATWNNTAGGDNNADITGVTVNFSQFGGGAAVVASNSSDTWTATYTIAAGTIDDVNKNVSITASTGTGSTTTADSTNATVDNQAPTVTDAKISISGATGTGSTFKIGDTVTATWNNTALGDNNADISGVTVDFSAFGGGSAVAASNSGDTWTATYTIVAGAIDGTNKNVSVTATDNAGNTKTTADTANATVDNVAPAVTDGNISISGATGTGGAYKIGDTVTATWNNTAGGDNNSDTISGVTVNFTAFGGGAAVAAINSSSTWTATYTIVSGAIDGTNRNISVTATDNAGNTTTTADTTNATVDNIASTVTDGNIGISGATGTGGAYKIGDTVTATWNNTAGGDNNSDTISGVTVDFSAFGGGAAVAASNSSSTWTATYTIVSGAIDGTNRNVSVTATDNAGNTTTTVDTTNATVDNIAPTVTDGSIGISGASGTGGVYKIGDTVTATWNNTAGGDNNSDTISGVTVDFSAFGGGAAVAASNSGGTWTAAYTIVSGAIDGTNRNISVTATDNAGNTTTTADTTNATVDNRAPTVTDGNISISGASGTGGAYKTGDTVTATWNNTAGGDNNSDTISSVTVNFTAFGGGAAVAATDSSSTWTATYTIVSGAIDGTNRNISVTATDNAGNTTTTADTTNATVDNIAPTVTDANISISGATGTGGAYKIGDTVTATWNNTAGGDNNSDTISGVTVDFSAFGGGAAVAASNSSGTWTATYTIVSGAIDGTNRNISVTATDNAGNTTTTADTTNATVDNRAPTVTDGNISISGATGTGGAYKIGDTVTATWNNTAGGDNNSDTIPGVTVNFTAFGGGAAVTASNSGGTWTAAYTIVSGSIDNATNRNVSVTATDNAGNATTTADTSNATVDNVAPTITFSALSFSDDTGTSNTDFITKTAAQTISATLSGAPAVGDIVYGSLDNGSTWTDITSKVSGTTLTWDSVTLTASNTLKLKVTDSAGNDGTVRNQAYTLDTTAPTTTIATKAFSADTGTSSTDFITKTAAQTISGTLSAVTVAGEVVEVSLDNGATWAPATNTIGQNSWTLSGQTLTSSNTLKVRVSDAAGNNGTASSQAYVLDTTLPALSTATINGTQLVLTYTEAGSGIESGSALQIPEYVVRVGGTPVTVNSVTQNAAAKTVTLTLATAVLSTDTVTVSYTANGTVVQELQDVAGNLAANLVNQVVTNNTIILQTIGVISFTPSTLIVAGTTTASATATSGLTVSFSALTPSVCTVSGTTVTGVAPGVCTIAADQAGNGTYAAAPQVTRSFTVAAAAGKVHLDHLGTVTDYNTIQSAADAAVDGDTINIDAGTFVEQVTVTKAITIQGAGKAATFIKAPVNASLVASSQNTIHNKKRLPILDLRTSTPGTGTITVRNLGIDGDYQGHTQAQDATNDNWLLGIATFDTNAVIDNVDIQRTAAPLEGGGTYEGLSRHDGILAEGSSALAAPVTVTVQNSTIGTFQKAGILAWGPKLNAVITNNHISGVGILGKSGQSGIQIGSSAPRNGATATISGNTIDQVGAPDSLAGYGATGILHVYAGTVEAYNNTITLDSGASANKLVGIDVGYSSDVATLHDNTLNGMSVGIQVDAPLLSAIHQIVSNTLTTTGGEPVVFQYNPAGGDTGGETIANFGPGYAIQVVGENFSSGTLSTGTGTGLAANSVQASVSGGSTMLYVDSTVATGGATAPLAVTLNGSYLLGNFALSGEYIYFTKINQTISFANPGSQTYGTSPTLTATADSGLTVSFTSGTTGVCTITSGGVLTFVSAGTCIINADQAGNGNYNAASQVSRTFTIGKATASVNLSALAQTYDGTAKTATVTTTPAGLTVNVTYDGSATAPTNAGSYAVIATINEANYQGSASGTLAIGKAAQSITFGTAPAITFGGSGTVSATATSGLAVSFTSTTPTVCTVSGTTVTGLAAGTCTIAADQSGNGNYNAATQVTQSITIGKASQTITFGTAPTVFVGTTGTVSATATSGQSVHFTSMTPLVCSVNGTTVTGIAPGTCTIVANQAGNGNYNAASQATQNMTVVVPLSLFVSTLSNGAVTTETTVNVCGLVSNPTFLSSLTVNGVAVQVGTFGLFSYPVQLLAGANTITVVATSTAGDVITDTRTITLDTTAPHLTITYPPDLKSVIQQFITVTGTISSLFKGTAKVAPAVTGGTVSVTYTVNGSTPQIAAVTDDTYSFDVTLDQGMNTIQVAATDSTGTTSQAKRTVSYSPGFSLAVTDPASDIRTVEDTYLLTGTVADNTTPVTVTVTMDGQTYTPTVVNGAFQQALPLSAAKVYQISITGTDQNSNTASVQRNIIRTVPLANGTAPAFSIVDALLALQMAVGLIQPQTDQILRMDVAPMVNGVSVGDGAVNLEDAVVILRMVVGLI